MEARAGDPTRRVEYPPRYEPGVSPDRPALAGREIDEGETRRRRPAKARTRADEVEVRKGANIAGQHEMVAVVDLHAEGGIEIRAATPARLVGRLMKRDRQTARGQPHGGGQSRQTRADDMDLTRRQTRP